MAGEHDEEARAVQLAASVEETSLPPPPPSTSQSSSYQTPTRDQFAGQSLPYRLSALEALADRTTDDSHASSRDRTGPSPLGTTFEHLAFLSQAVCDFACGIQDLEQSVAQRVALLDYYQKRVLELESQLEARDDQLRLMRRDLEACRTQMLEVICAVRSRKERQPGSGGERADGSVGY